MSTSLVAPDVYLGYDPGGIDAHGVAVLRVQNGVPVSAAVAVVPNGAAAVQWLTATGGASVRAIGIDTLTVLNTGHAGWRPADLWLQQQYPPAAGSVMSPNGIRGSMPLNGIAVASRLRAAYANLVVSETHPKVLYFALSGAQYDWQASQAAMIAQLQGWLQLAPGLIVGPLAFEDAWDALISALAAWKGHAGQWTQDLHSLPVTPPGESVLPIGATVYYWPP